MDTQVRCVSEATEVRKLDCEIAEKVMGWTDALEGYNSVLNADPTEEFAAEIITGKRPQDGMYWHVPKYTTDANAAFTIVDRLRKDGWEMTLSVNHYVTEPWDCRLFLLPRPNQDAPDRRVIAHGATAPEAICRAAQQAINAK